MNIEALRTYCLSLPAVTEDIKWGDNLVFSVGGKMFLLADLEPPLTVAFKVAEEDFEQLTATSGIIQAPYFAKNMWVKVMDESVFTTKEWENYILQAYNLVFAKLPKKTRESISGTKD